MGAMSELQPVERVGKRSRAVDHVLEGEDFMTIIEHAPPDVPLPESIAPPDPYDGALSKRGWELAMGSWRQRVRVAAATIRAAPIH